mmetsp:Transcript_3950/g.9111  ORF Transcript_3950/g.9111 Transcript_3950/m.9111 type:complete len:108 (-) Transcript_3950:2635-2958(-)
MRVCGTRGFSPSYVIGDEVAVPAAPTTAQGRPYSLEDGSLVNYEFTVRRASHDHPKHNEDNGSVLGKTTTVTDAPSIAPSEETRDGRGTVPALPSMAQFLKTSDQRN